MYAIEKILDPTGALTPTPLSSKIQSAYTQQRKYPLRFKGSTVVGYGMEGRGSIPGRGNIFFYTASRFALGPSSLLSNG
jgi:hypothetical protein